VRLQVRGQLIPVRGKEAENLDSSTCSSLLETARFLDFHQKFQYVLMSMLCRTKGVAGWLKVIPKRFYVAKIVCNNPIPFQRTISTIIEKNLKVNRYK